MEESRATKVKAGVDALLPWKADSGAVREEETIAAQEKKKKTSV